MQRYLKPNDFSTASKLSKIAGSCFSSITICIWAYNTLYKY